jgi:hypothetical protein
MRAAGQRIARRNLPHHRESIGSNRLGLEAFVTEGV